MISIVEWAPKTLGLDRLRRRIQLGVRHINPEKDPYRVEDINPALP